jgi:O-antigen ligase
VWEYVSRHGAKWQLGLAWLGTAAVVLLASNRQSWIIFAIASLIWGWVYARRLGFLPARLLAPIVLIAAVAGVGAYQANPKFAERVDKSLTVLDFSYESLNAASSTRLHLWRNAVNVLESHPINGAGVRSYRYAYAQFAEAGDPFMNPDGTGQIYAHQLLLEVGSETGVIGLAGMVAFFVIYLRAGKGLSNSPLAWVAWLGAFAWLFPINTHTALYSAYWSMLIGWLIAIGLTRTTQGP